MSWMYLVFAGFFEVAFTTFLKLSGNFTHPWYSGAFILSSAMSFYCLSLSLSTIPLGTSYAIWVGIGAFGTALVGIIFFQEPFTLLKLLFFILLVGSIIGIKVCS
jgi:quaternary ammonium compound-resistance protein SugE